MRMALIALGYALAACSASTQGTSEQKPAADASTGGQPAAGQPTAGQPAVAQVDECTQYGAHEACTLAAGTTGARMCDVGAQGYVWNACLPTDNCDPAVSSPCFPPGSMYGGTVVCRVTNGAWTIDRSGCNTPLVLAFDDEPVTFTNPTGAFDVTGAESAVPTDWVSSRTPWLVLDRNANGTIDDGAELFGSMTRLPDGRRATNGFMALAALDADGDGWITAKDPAFARLALWRDRDQDRTSTADELRPVAESVVALSLDYTDVPRCVAGSCEHERAAFIYRDRAGNERRGSVIDVYLSDR